VSAGVGICGGVFIGWLLNLSFFMPPKTFFDDRLAWRECEFEEFEYLGKVEEGE